MKLGVALPVDHEVWEAPKRHSPGAMLGTNTRNRRSNGGVPENQSQDPPDLDEEFLPQARTSFLVPLHCSSELVLRRRADSQPAHFFRSSASIRRRTSSQSEVTASPVSSATQRRSISAAHASSRSGSVASSRLSIRRAATSARSSSGRFKASCRILSPTVDMPASYHKGPFEVVAVAAANEATRQQMLSLGSGVRVSSLMPRRVGCRVA